MASSDERRVAFRKPTALRGLVIGAGLELPCTITDVSKDGCRVRLERRLALPGQVVLVDMAAGVASEAQVVWERAGEVGLKIGARASLKGLTPSRFLAARSAWLRHAGR